MSCSQRHSVDVSNRVPLCVAVHEAGHAVAAIWEFGDRYEPFDRVIVRTKQQIMAGPFIDSRGRARDIAGIVEGPDHFQAKFYREIDWTAADHPGTREPKIAAQMRRDAEAAAIVSLAGPIAEAMHRHVSIVGALLYGGEDDFDSATACMAFWHADKAARDDAVERLLRCAARLVRAHTSAIRAVAQALRMHHELGADEVRAIIAAH